MNKFTRSQMGKIMAYALSAAMAVTVVPTYMMKPLVAEAAVTAAVETQEISNGKELTVATATDKKTRFALFTKYQSQESESEEFQTGDNAVYVFDAVDANATKLTTLTLPASCSQFGVGYGNYY